MHDVTCPAWRSHDMCGITLRDRMTSQCAAAVHAHCEVMRSPCRACMHTVGVELHTCNAFPAVLDSVQLLEMVLTAIPWKLQLWADLHTDTMHECHPTGETVKHIVTYHGTGAKSVYACIEPH